MVRCKFAVELDAQRFLQDSYCCETLGCHYHYDVTLGYFLTSQGERKVSDENYRVLCPKQMTKMYIAEFETQIGKRTWKCGQIGCTERRITEGPLQANSAAP
jgi:hypothetical protein